MLKINVESNFSCVIVNSTNKNINEMSKFILLLLLDKKNKNEL